MREKWNREDYRDRTIANVLALVHETYTAPPRLRVSAEPAPTQPGTGTDAQAQTTETQDQTPCPTCHVISSGLWAEA